MFENLLGTSGIWIGLFLVKTKKKMKTKKQKGKRKRQKENKQKREWTEEGRSRAEEGRLGFWNPNCEGVSANTVVISIMSLLAWEVIPCSPDPSSSRFDLYKYPFSPSIRGGGQQYREES